MDCTIISSQDQQSIFFCIDEANSLLTKLSHPSKSAQNVKLPMERLCKCFDDDCWFILKGNKGKRSGVASARASIIPFTTPRQFLSKAWPWIINADSGLADRILFMYQSKAERDLDEMAELSEQLEVFSRELVERCARANFCGAQYW